MRRTLPETPSACIFFALPQSPPPITCSTAHIMYRARAPALPCQIIRVSSARLSYIQRNTAKQASDITPSS
nr:MAG TPA: hypothetical protein [Caudoviricetes sp.]